MSGRLRLAAASVVMVTAWRWLRDWGATPAERWRILPGDELIRDSADMTTLAVPIVAAAADMWPWLIQIGPRRLVLLESPPSLPWNAVWSFHTVPTSAGSCRLISRSRGERPRVPLRFAGVVMTPLAAAMTRRMLLGVKARAERGVRLARSADAAPAPA